MEKGRSLFTISILGFKFVTGIKQRLSEFNLISAMNQASGKNDGARWLLKGHQMVGWKSNAYGEQKQEIVDFVHNRSKIMKVRALG